MGLDNIGRLEDPPFPHQAGLYRVYSVPGCFGAPGRAAGHREDRTVTARAALDIIAWNRAPCPGAQRSRVELHRWVTVAQAPQIWDELRRRVSEAAERLPSGAKTPHVEDDFSDVYGILYAVDIPSGYTIAELQDAARLLQSRLQNVKHVAKVQLDGVPEERVFIDLDNAQLVQLGIPQGQVVGKIRAQTDLNGASSVRSGDRRMRIAPLEQHTTIAQLEQILIGEGGASQMLPLGSLADYLSVRNRATAYYHSPQWPARVHRGRVGGDLGERGRSGSRHRRKNPQPRNTLASRHADSPDL